MLDPTYIFVSLIFSSIGLGYFIYGKKQKNKISFYSGIGLMVYPYFIANLIMLVIAGVVLMLLPRFIQL